METASLQNREGPSLRIEERGDLTRLIVGGSWMLRELSRLSSREFEGRIFRGKIVLNGAKLSDLDTAGATALLDILHTLQSKPTEVTLEQFSPRASAIFTLMSERYQQRTAIPTSASEPLLERGFNLYFSVVQSIYNQISFFGEILHDLFSLLVAPRKVRLKELVIQLERAGIKAVPIISLVTFLIGLVVAYLFANQAAKFGASIFIVDAVGMGVCRELSPVLVAILVAGRSGSAFTAQIGTMKINEEIDAIRVLGLSPMQVLVIPRILALLIIMPLLVVVGDLFGILGGVLIANGYLEIPPATFFDRLYNVLAVRHFWIGLIKAPVFAFVIAFIGCRQGLTVEDNARSVGLKTTSTVVKSIVAVILLNAAFAILFQELRW